MTVFVYLKDKLKTGSNFIKFQKKISLLYIYIPYHYDALASNPGI